MDKWIKFLIVISSVQTFFMIMGVLAIVGLGGDISNAVSRAEYYGRRAWKEELKPQLDKMVCK